MSLATFIDDEEMTFAQGTLVVAGWFAVIAVVVDRGAILGRETKTWPSTAAQCPSEFR
jgi:hypothetical protein